MIPFIGVELALGVVFAAVFLAVFGAPWRSDDPGMSWHIASFSATVLGEMACFLLLVLGVPVPVWVFAVVFGALDAVIVWRLWLLVRARRRPG